MSVKEIILQQNAYVMGKGVTQEKTSERNFSFNYPNAFESGKQKLEQYNLGLGTRTVAPNPLFDNKSLRDMKIAQKASGFAAAEIPQNDMFGLAKFANYLKNINAKVNGYDKAVGVVKSNLVAECDIADAYESNPRLQAIVRNGILNKIQV